MMSLWDWIMSFFANPNEEVDMSEEQPIVDEQPEAPQPEAQSEPALAPEPAPEPVAEPAPAPAPEPAPAPAPEPAPVAEPIVPPVFSDVYSAGAEAMKAAIRRLKDAKAAVSDAQTGATLAQQSLDDANTELAAAKENAVATATAQQGLLADFVQRNSA